MNSPLYVSGGRQAGRSALRHEVSRDAYQCPRTLVDAFGPGAQLDTPQHDHREPGVSLLPLVMCLGYIALCVWIVATYLPV